MPGERAETALDELFAATAATATALAGVEELREPAPLAARAVKPRATVAAG